MSGSSKKRRICETSHSPTDRTRRLSSFLAMFLCSFHQADIASLLPVIASKPVSLNLMLSNSESCPQHCFWKASSFSWKTRWKAACRVTKRPTKAVNYELTTGKVSYCHWSSFHGTRNKLTKVCTACMKMGNSVMSWPFNAWYATELSRMFLSDLTDGGGKQSANFWLRSDNKNHFQHMCVG